MTNAEYWKQLAGKSKPSRNVALPELHDGYMYPADLFAWSWKGRPGELLLHGKRNGKINILDPHDMVDGQYRILYTES
jgi:hypothetical protein